MSIVPHPLPITEGKVYKTKKNKNKHLTDEEAAMKELETILSIRNRRPCDCEGQEHELVANCLGCGRIICVAEGPGHCLTCGNLVLDKDQKSRLQEHINLIPGTTNINSSTTKDARIIDAHFNDYNLIGQRWLSDNDRKALRKEVDDLQAAKYRRKYMLHVDIDKMICGAEAVPEIDDFEEQLRNLQSKTEQLSVAPKHDILLRDVIALEANKVFKFKYLSEEDRDETKRKNHSQVKASKARSVKSSKGNKQPGNKNAGQNSSAKQKQVVVNKQKQSNNKETNSKTKKTPNEKIITQTKLAKGKKKVQPQHQQQNTPSVKNVWKDNARDQLVKKDSPSKNI